MPAKVAEVLFSCQIRPFFNWGGSGGKVNSVKCFMSSKYKTWQGKYTLEEEPEVCLLKILEGFGNFIFKLTLYEKKTFYFILSAWPE